MTGGTYRRMRFFCKKMCTSIADRTLPKKPSVYRTFDEYLRWATIHRAIRAPFDESDKRVLGFFDGQHQRFYSRFSKDKEGPLVSIIMPTYNRCNVIGHAIESVLQQSYRNWEMLIVDDGGTDATEKFVYQYQDSRIEYPHNPHNQGKVNLVGPVVLQLRTAGPLSKKNLSSTVLPQTMLSHACGWLQTHWSCQ